MNKIKFKILVVIAVCLVLAFSFLEGGNVDDKSVVEDAAISQLEDTNDTEAVFEKSLPQNQEEEIAAKSQSQNNIQQASPLPTKDEKQQNELTEEKKSEKTQAENAQSEATPAPQTGSETDTGKQTMCTLYVNCKSVLQNYDKLKENKKSVVPPNGVIYEEKRVSFYEGESVFDVLKREMKNSEIQLEFVYTPMYNSVYIEGIGNLYEFDCGDTSGWQYRVNGLKPNYGCSQYVVKDGDSIEFYYSCNFLGEN